MPLQRATLVNLCTVCTILESKDAWLSFGNWQCTGVSSFYFTHPALRRRTSQIQRNLVLSHYHRCQSGYN